jgi:hypothetical protein
MYIDDHQLICPQNRLKEQPIALRPAQRYYYSNTTRFGNAYGQPRRNASTYVQIREGLGQVAPPSPTPRPSNSSQTSLIEDALSLKLESLAIGIAVLQGRENENDLTDLVFFAKHQGLKDRKIDPKINPKLVQEWNRILRNVVRPTLKAARRKVRSKYLRKLAAYPPEAHTEWKKLKPVEQAHVVTFMAKHYGKAFASRFLEYAAGQRKRDLTLVRNIWFVDTLRKTLGPYPKWLLDRSYKLGGTWKTTSAVYDEWFHPSGRWYTVIRPLTESKPQVPVTEQPAVAEEHPSLIEARNYAEDFAWIRDRIIDETRWLRNNIRHPDYCRRYREYWRIFNDWQNQLNFVIKHAKSTLREEVEQQDRSVLETDIRRLEDLFRWKQEEWPKLVRDLRHCE